MPPSEQPVVAFTDVEKRFGSGPLILGPVSFNARRGDFVSLIGPSGCGKSTLLRLIAGLAEPSAGHITINGRDPAETGEELAYVFQEPTLLPWLTVARNVEVPLRLRGAPAEKRRRAAEEMLSLVRLSDRADYYPRQLSGGQKMRASIARALSVSPGLLLLDEPFGALDEMTRNHLNEELLAIRAEMGWTAFFVTHSVAEAVFLSNRIVVLSANPGRIHREIAVPLAYPRTDATRETAVYQNLVAEVSRVLRSVEEAAPVAS